MTASLHALGCGADAGAYYVNDVGRYPRSKSRDEYYSAGNGTWWSTGSTLVVNGATVNPESFRALCAGRDPRNEAALVRGAGPKHRGGWDVTFTATKGTGLLWAAGTAAQRKEIEAEHEQSVNRALELIKAERLMEIRRGAGGKIKEAATDLLVAKFVHYTSREGDPNLHTHCVFINVACSADGIYRTLEPSKIYEQQLLIGSAYRAELASRLVRRGFSLRDAGTNQFEIGGIPDSLLEIFSKRSRQIKSRTRDNATAAEKEIAALATRSAKDEIPYGPELEASWREQFAKSGIDPWIAGLEAGRKVDTRDLRSTTEPDRQFEFDPLEVVGSGVVVDAANRLFRHESVVRRPNLLRESFVGAALAGIPVDAVYENLKLVEAAGSVVRLEDDDRGMAWTTHDIARIEANLLRTANCSTERAWFDEAAIEAALKGAPYLSEEQQFAFRSATQPNSVSIIEAGAGTGKTTLTAALFDAARRSDLRVIGLAPSWVAADALEKATGIEALAIAKWRQSMRTGAETIDRQTILIVDEAGMVGIRDMEEIIQTAAGVGAKIVLIGDRRQLSPVAAGNALGLVADAVDRVSTIATVRRQVVDWQRRASEAMAGGDTAAGLHAYASEDRVQLVEGEAAAQDKTINAWSEFRELYGQDVLIITRRNVDAKSLNERARIVLKHEGRLVGEDVRLPSIGRDGKVSEIAMTTGDRLRLGTALPQFGLLNGSTLIVSGMETGQSGAHPKVTFIRADGTQFAAPWSELVRNPLNGHSDLAPSVSHAYAGTFYASQGKTSAASVVYIGSATESRELYVGLTRHRHDAVVIAERGRLDAAARLRQEDPREAPTKTALLEKLYREAQRVTEKTNVADYVPDRAEFVRTGEIATTRSRSSSLVIETIGAPSRMLLSLPKRIWSGIAERSASTKRLESLIVDRVKTFLGKREISNDLSRGFMDR